MLKDILHRYKVSITILVAGAVLGTAGFWAGVKSAEPSPVVTEPTVNSTPSSFDEQVRAVAEKATDPTKSIECHIETEKYMALLRRLENIKTSSTTANGEVTDNTETALINREMGKSYIRVQELCD